MMRNSNIRAPVTSQEPTECKVLISCRTDFTDECAPLATLSLQMPPCRCT